MAHNITGRDSIAYAGETPWHGIGKALAGLATTADIIREASLEWTVKAVQLYADADPSLGPLALVPGFIGIKREDTGDMLGVASVKYRPLQNAQAFEIVDALVAEGRAIVEVAGSLREGRMVWALSRLPEDFEVISGDLIRPYFLLAWGHDGKHGVAGTLTPVRVVCNNTLTAALGAKWSERAQVYFQHTGDMKVRLAEAREALGIVKRQAEETVAAYRELAAFKLDHKALGHYFSDVFPAPTAYQDEEAEPFSKRMDAWQDLQNKLVRLYRYGAGNDTAGASGTAWAAYNAVTEWFDHHYPVLKSGAVSQIRQQSVLFGGKAAVKARALKSALAIVTGR